MRNPAEVRAAIVAQASRGKTDDGTTVTTERSRVTTGGAKGGRKANPNSDGPSEETSPVVPVADKQGEEDLWQRHKAERGVWSQGMLEALERGVKGGKWFSLIDKVYQERTMAMGWEKVKSNGGACGMDGITAERFDQDSQKRLLTVKERLQRGDYRPQPIKRVWIPKPGSAEQAEAQR
jgi:hypothetical protein